MKKKHQLFAWVTKDQELNNFLITDRYDQSRLVLGFDVYIDKGMKKDYCCENAWPPRKIKITIEDAD